MTVATPTPPEEATRAHVGTRSAYPEDWKLEALGNYVDIASGESPSRFIFAGSGTPYFKVEQLNNSNKYLGRRQTPYFTVNSRAVPAGSVVFPKRGASIVLNKVRLLAEAGYMDTNLMAITPRAGLLSEYLYYAITHVKLWTFADTTSIPQINNKHIKPLMIPLPNTAEQRAIARVLADVDAAIDASQALLAKRRGVKLGVMQDLLTGRRRLPGYTTPWRSCALGDLGTFSKGKGIKRDDVVDEGVACIRYGEIYTRYDAYIETLHSRVPQSVAATAQPISQGDILIAASGETADEIGTCVAYTGHEPAYAGGDIVVFTPSGCDSVFLGHLLNHGSVRQQKERFAQGDAVVHISATNLGRLTFELPPLPEQHAIAAVLRDIDAQVAATRRRHAKMVAIKQGITEALLSGRVRLSGVAV